MRIPAAALFSTLVGTIEGASGEQATGGLLVVQIGDLGAIHREVFVSAAHRSAMALRREAIAPEHDPEKCVAVFLAKNVKRLGGDVAQTTS